MNTKAGRSHAAARFALSLVIAACATTLARPGIAREAPDILFDFYWATRCQFLSYAENVAIERASETALFAGAERDIAGVPDIDDDYLREVADMRRLASRAAYQKDCEDPDAAQAITQAARDEITVALLVGMAQGKLPAGDSDGRHFSRDDQLVARRFLDAIGPDPAWSARFEVIHARVEQMLAEMGHGGDRPAVMVYEYYRTADSILRAMRLQAMAQSVDFSIYPGNGVLDQPAVLIDNRTGEVTPIIGEPLDIFINQSRPASAILTVTQEGDVRILTYGSDEGLLTVTASALIRMRPWPEGARAPRPDTDGMEQIAVWASVADVFPLPPSDATCLNGPCFDLTPALRDHFLTSRPQLFALEFRNDGRPADGLRHRTIVDSTWLHDAFNPR